MLTKLKAEGGTVQKMFNFAILGTGLAAGFHAEAIKNIPDARVFCVADYNVDRAAYFAEKYDAKVFASFDEMLDSADVDAVCICTPSGYHKEQAIKALKSGKHVVLEKPMALNTADADEIIAAVEKAGVALTGVFQNRFLPDVQKAKEVFESGALGKIVFCDLSMKYWRDPEYYASSDWRGTLKHDGGGALINQGIHGVDMLLYIVGDAKVRFAKVKTSFHDIEAEDTAVALLDFDNGATGTLHASTCAYPGFNRRIEIIGTEGCMILSEGNIERLVVGKETLIDGSVQKRGSSADHTVMDTTCHTIQLKNFIKATRGEEKLFVDGREARRALALIEEVYAYRQ